jgi:hypothetical protein
MKMAIAETIQISRPVGVDRVRLFVVGDHIAYGTYESANGEFRYCLEHAPTQQAFNAIAQALDFGAKVVEVSE